MRSKIKDPWSFYIHFVSAIIATIGVVYLIATTEPGSLQQLSVKIYGFTLILLFAASSSYHFFNAPLHVNFYLRKIDHSAIFLFIAGTYTPVCLFKLSGDLQKYILSAVWTFAVLGVLFKVLFFKAPRWVSTAIYVLMGWVVVFALKSLLHNLTAEGIFWLFLGGAFYTVGAIVYATKRFDLKPGVFGFHEVWHLFVSAGATAHFILIAKHVL